MQLGISRTSHSREESSTKKKIRYTRKRTFVRNFTWKMQGAGEKDGT